MILWRISNHSTLDGRGGLHASARWHYKGRPIVYLASSPAGALLEVLVHLEIKDGRFPPHFQLLKLQVPNSISHRAVAEGSLAEGWTEDARISRAIGSRWLEASTSALLQVPSAIVPETTNWLLNPVHKESPRLTIEWGRKFPFDGRLLRPQV
jgi:RES domain-containing protein